ncbi:MAG: metallophosphoesterase [Desulfobacterales bacterium]|nr:metallophosphoesterase [Desulfobacterales bacterium]
MKILHTSDWHIGRALYGRKRYQEFELFLDWLIGRIAAEGVGTLLVAGDIFDNGTPSNRALSSTTGFCVAAPAPAAGMWWSRPAITIHLRSSMLLARCCGISISM